MKGEISYVKNRQTSNRDPAGVTVKIGDANEVVVKGAKGELTRKFNNDMKIEVEGNQIVVTRPSDDKEHRAASWPYTCAFSEHGQWREC